MTRLWHAFLELPSWQGSALIASAVIVLAAVALCCLRIGYACGCYEALTGEDSDEP